MSVKENLASGCAPNVKGSQLEANIRNRSFGSLDILIANRRTAIGNQFSFEHVGPAKHLDLNLFGRNTVCPELLNHTRN